MTRFAAGVVGLLALAPVSLANSPDPAGLAVPPDQVARARQLVRQLGSDAYRERDRAARELRGMGRLAVSALAGAASAETDPEVRARCEDLLPAAEADDMAARAAAFLADADGQYDHDVPGWAEFRAAVGDGKDSRGLFSAVLKNPDNHPLLRATRRPADRLPGAVVARRQRLQLQLTTSGRRPILVDGEYVQANQPDPADVAALLLAESLTPDRPVFPPAFRHNGTEYYVTMFLHLPKGREAVAADPAFRRLVVTWLETRNGPSGPIQAINVAEQLKLGPDVYNRLAGRALSADGLVAAWKDIALRILVRNNGRDQLSAVVKLFADDTLLEKRLPNAASPDDLRLKDAALLAAVRLTGQSPADYGFTTGPGTMAPQPLGVGQGFGGNQFFLEMENTYTQRFRSAGGVTADQKRAAAFKKWDEWAATNLPASK